MSQRNGCSVAIPDPATLLRGLFDAAVAAADPSIVVPPHLPPPPAGRTVIIGAGKASAAMARAVDAHWPADAPLAGVVVAQHGQCSPRIEVLHAAHPVPDETSVAAARRMLEAVRGLTADDLVLALVSGGGSALMALPAPGLPLADKQAITQALLRAGAPITEINTVRRHLSAIKGGHLARACAPAAVHALLISDVPDDDPLTIAAGPLSPDPTTAAAATAIFARYGIPAPAALAETPKPGDPAFARVRHTVVASGTLALHAAAASARAAGLAVVNLGPAIEGEAREVARALAGIALACARFGTPAAPPCVLLSGGETTVALRGAGQGGRNTEFALALALALNGHPRIWALAADTDGIDGTGPAAGAIVTPTTLARGPDAQKMLDRNDSGAYFAALGDLVTTGPTGTNVNDFRVVLID